MWTPTRETVRRRIFRANEYRRYAGNVDSRRNYEDINQWLTFGVDLPFHAGWSAASGAYGPPQVLLDPLGIVHLRGTLESGPGGGEIALLPPTWGPTTIYRLPVFVNVVAGTSAGTVSSYYIYADSSVLPGGSNDRLISPGMAGFPGGSGATTVRIALGYNCWQKRPA